MSLAEYFIGAGDILVAQLDANGIPTAFRDVGEAPMFEWNPTVEYADNFKTGKTGPNLQDLHVVIKASASLKLTLKERTALNLELFLHGASSTEVTGSYTANEAIAAAGVTAGQRFLIPGNHGGITALIVKDSAGTPATVAADGTKYTYDGDSGIITFVDVTGFTQPFKAFSYTYKASSSVKILSKTPPDLCVIFDGINLAVPGEKVWARIDRVSFGPAAKIALKAGGAGGTANAADEYELDGVALLAPGKVQSDGLGIMRTF